MRQPLRLTFDVAAVWNWLIIPPQNHQIVVWSMSIWNGVAAQNVQALWGDGAISGSLSGLIVNMPISTGVVWSQELRPLWILPIGQNLGLNGSAAGRLTGFVVYSIIRTEEDWDAVTFPTVENLAKAIQQLLHKEPTIVPLDTSKLTNTVQGPIESKDRTALIELLQSVLAGK